MTEPETYDYRLSHIDPEKGPTYDASFVKNPWRAFLWRREQAFLDRIAMTYFGGEKIHHLDFACGTGRILKHLAKRASVSVGVDVSDSMLEVCRQKAPSATLLQADLTTNDVLCDAKYNLITAFRFFPNAQHSLRVHAMRVLFRHLADDGVLVFNNHKNRSSSFHVLSRFVGKQHHTMTHPEAEALVRGAGLEVRRIGAFGTLPACDRLMLFPAVAHRAADALANAAFLGRRIAQDVVYVCRKAEAVV